MDSLRFVDSFLTDSKIDTKVKYRWFYSVGRQMGINYLCETI